MLARACLALLFSLALGCGSSEEVFTGELTASVVYGPDDRVEVFNHPDAELRQIAQESIVALIPTFRMTRESDGTHSLLSETLKDLRGLCPDELFVNQPTAAACSGVLIDDDLVLTAGHCIDAQAPCDSYSYVFNYHLVDSTNLAVIRDEDVYACARVISQGAPEGEAFTPDFAVVQLDRPVEGARSRASIRPATPLEEQERVAMIGFGSGLPAKIDSGGSVADPRAEKVDFFVANVDAFQGHSGSATFDRENRLAGILIGGRTPDYVTLDGESCGRVSIYENSQAAELIHSIAPIVAALCDAAWSGEEICEPTACDGQPCGGRTPAPSGPGTNPGGSSGCSASNGFAGPTGSTGLVSWSLGLVLLLLMRRFRRPVA